jgi:hypothetical protein
VKLVRSREVHPYDLLGISSVLLTQAAATRLSETLSEALAKCPPMTIVIKRPLVTEKGVTKKEEERRCASKWRADANKIQVKAGGREAFQGESGRRPDGERSTASCGGGDVSRAIARTGKRLT